MITPTQTLQDDHDTLRGKLAVLEGLLTVPEVGEVPLRATVQSIARFLQCHTEREGVLLAALRDARRGRAQELSRHLADDHKNQRETLEILLRLLGSRDEPPEHIATYASHFIDEMREHMEQEEERLFPMAEKMLSAAQTAQVLALMSSVAVPKTAERRRHAPRDTHGAVITEEMTVNHVLRIHPFAREIFRAFKIDWSVDGCHHLDELFWRRGIDVERLMEALHLTVAE